MYFISHTYENQLCVCEKKADMNIKHDIYIYKYNKIALRRLFGSLL